ncbi:MAG: antibiotic biosynthesis monooxygenase [Hyphomonadaceae bacterium]|jgi:quinol monooxygenase YgiN|nr:antibiotic biosynthesis monooxygenase [Hyphomonadaceae bacterium]
MIGICAQFVCAEGKAAEFEAMLGEFVTAVKASEAGTITYQLFADSKRPNHYFMLEIYADQAALDAHGKTDHMAALLGRIGPLLGGAPVITQGNAVH